MCVCIRKAFCTVQPGFHIPSCRLKKKKSFSHVRNIHCLLNLSICVDKSKAKDTRALDMQHKPKACLGFEMNLLTRQDISESAHTMTGR
jgi:hypothetical protein